MTDRQMKKVNLRVTHLDADGFDAVLAGRKKPRAALGVVGIASYAGAAVQDVVSGFTIQSGKSVGTADAVANYDFSVVTWFWIGAAILSVLCALAVWGMSKRKE